LDTPINTSDLVGTSSIDEDFVIVNQMIKFYKFGFGKTTEYLNELIRAKKISREDAIDIATEYDGACSDKYIAKFCNYLSISQNEFWEVVNAHTNKQLFHLRRTGRPIPKFKVGQDLIL
jgi:hypothetical protein